MASYSRSWQRAFNHRTAEHKPDSPGNSPVPSTIQAIRVPFRFANLLDKVQSLMSDMEHWQTDGGRIGTGLPPYIVKNPLKANGQPFA